MKLPKIPPLNEQEMNTAFLLSFLLLAIICLVAAIVVK
jgi:hypothetical protein